MRCRVRSVLLSPVSDPLLEQSCEWWVYDNGNILDLVPGRTPTWAGYAPDVQTTLSEANRAGKASVEIQVVSKLTNAVSHLFVRLGPTPVQVNVSSGTERSVMRLAPNEGTREGPLFEERSAKLSPAVIEAAQVAWEGDDWDDEDTLEYVIFALSVSHHSVRTPPPPGFVLFKWGSGGGCTRHREVATAEKCARNGRKWLDSTIVTCKISDFGAAAALAEDGTEYVRSNEQLALRWCSIEVVKEGKYSVQSHSR